MYEIVTEELGQKAIVIESDDLLEQPGGQKYFQNGIVYKFRRMSGLYIVPDLHIW